MCSNLTPHDVKSALLASPNATLETYAVWIMHCSRALHGLYCLHVKYAFGRCDRSRLDVMWYQGLLLCKQVTLGVNVVIMVVVVVIVSSLFLILLVLFVTIVIPVI